MSHFLLQSLFFWSQIVKIITKTVQLALMPSWTYTISCNDHRATCEWLGEKNLHIKGSHTKACAFILQEPHRDTRWCIIHQLTKNTATGIPQVSNTINVLILISTYEYRYNCDKNTYDWQWSCWNISERNHNSINKYTYKRWQSNVMNLMKALSKWLSINSYYN